MFISVLNRGPDPERADAGHRRADPADQHGALAEPGRDSGRLRQRGGHQVCSAATCPSCT